MKFLGSDWTKEEMMDMLWIGLTGGIATGKSTVSKILTELGHAVVDADQIAHQAFVPGTPTYEKVVATFGMSCLDEQGRVDRQKLGELVFSDPKQLSTLEAIVHPFVQAKVADLRCQYKDRGHKLAFYDVPLLFEKSLQEQFDQTLLVYCPEETQVSRMKQRDALSDREIEQRLRAQIPIDEKKALATEVIDNSADLRSLRENILSYLSRFE